MISQRPFILGPEVAARPRRDVHAHLPPVLEGALMRNTRKPFVTPTLKEQASLAKVTLISGGGGGVPTFKSNRRRGHGHGHGHGHS